MTTATPETATPAEAVAQAMEQIASTPEERQKQFQAFMAKVLGDISRLSAQVAYTGRHSTTELTAVHDRIDYLQGCMGVLFDAMHLQMPPLTPKLIDAKVELTTVLDEGEVCEMRASYSETPHPIYGNMQLVIGSGDDAQSANPAQMHTVIVQRLNEAFAGLRAANELEDGAFYYVRLSLIHAQPINENSVAYQAEPAANDDMAPAESMETSDVQPE